MAEKKELLTIKEVAEMLGMKPTTIYVWAQSGKLPAIKMGRTWRFRRSSIEAWLTKCESEGSTGDAPQEPITDEETYA